MNKLFPWYRKKVNDSKLPLEVAKGQMLKDKEAKKRIKNYTPHRDFVDKKLREAYAMITAKDNRKKQEAGLKGKGYYVLSHPVETVEAGKCLARRMHCTIC